MTAIQYDLVMSAARTEEIRALIASPVLNPPQPERKKRKNMRNNNKCDSCGEEGNLIGCTTCPAAFHLVCHDPPLAKDDLPIRKWLCCRCKATREMGQRKRISRRAPNESSSSSSRHVDPDVINPFDALINEARTSNPSQYQLPSELVVNTKFPGSSKETKSKKKKKSSEKSDVKLCYKCSRSSLHGPLVQCDYCPLLFHCDCLETPLTNLPGPSRWMCPNHPEHILDEKILKTVGLSKRVRLWKNCSAPVNQNTVKLQFFKKVNMGGPRFRSQVKQTPRKSAEIPGAIKQFYSLPPSLLPQTNDPIPHLVPDTSVGERVQWFCRIANLRQEIAQHLSSFQNTPDANEVVVKTEVFDPDEVVIKTEVFDSDENTAEPTDASSIPPSIEVDSEKTSTGHYEGVSIKMEPVSPGAGECSKAESEDSSSQGSEDFDNEYITMCAAYDYLQSEAQTSACSDETGMEAGPSCSLSCQSQHPLPTEWC